MHSSVLSHGQGRLHFSIFEAEKHIASADVRQVVTVKRASVATDVFMLFLEGFCEKTLVYPRQPVRVDSYGRCSSAVSGEAPLHIDTSLNVSTPLLYLGRVRNKSLARFGLRRGVGDCDRRRGLQKYL